MKKLRHILCLAALFLLAALPVARAQAPQRISYQAVVRDANDLLVRNADIRVRISIKQTTEDGTTVFSETHDVTTNTNGLFILNIGQGTLVSGNFATIDWGVDDYFVVSEISLDGGSSYPLTATQQLLSVPYALYSTQSDNAAHASTADVALSYTETQTLADVVANNNSAGNSQIKNLRNPTEAQDAVTKHYLDSVVAALTVIMTSPHRDTIVAKCGTFTWDRTGQTYTESGIYTYTMANAGCGGTCDSLLNLRLTIATPAAVALNDIVSAGGTSVCTGSEVNLSVEPSSYTGTSISYVWTALSGTDISSSSTNSATIDALAATSEYQVVATATPENTSVCGNASDTKTITITAKTVPSVSDLAIAATNSSIYCEDADSITLTASSTYTGGATIAYSWTPATGLTATTGASIKAAPGENVTYTVTAVATLEGCASAEQTTTQTVTFVNKPVIALSGLGADNTTVCAGTEVALTATVTSSNGTVSYAWSSEGENAGVATTPTATNTNTATPTSAGTKTYKVTATASVDGCANAVSDEVSVDVTVNAAPVLTFTTQPASATICSGNTANLTAEATSDGGETVTYLWSNSETGDNITVSAAGDYSVTASATNDAGCVGSLASNTATVTVETSSLTLGNIAYSGTSSSSATSGNGTSVTLDASTSMTLSANVTASNGSLSYAWSTSESGAIDQGTTASITKTTPAASSSTTYYLRVTNTTADASCVTTQDKSIVVTGAVACPDVSNTFSLSASPASVGTGSTSTITGSLTSGNYTAVTYDWSTTGGTLSNGTYSYTKNFSAESANTYTISCEAVLKSKVNEQCTVRLPAQTTVTVTAVACPSVSNLTLSVTPKSGSSLYAPSSTGSTCYGADKTKFTMTATLTATNTSGATITYNWSAGATSQTYWSQSYNSNYGVSNSTTTNSVSGTVPTGNTGTKYFGVKVTISKSGCSNVTYPSSGAIYTNKYISSCS